MSGSDTITRRAVFRAGPWAAMWGLWGFVTLAVPLAQTPVWAAAAPIQDEQDEQTADVRFTTKTLTQGGITILGVTRVGSSLPGTPVFGLAQNAAFELHRLIGATYPTTVILAEPAASDRIRAAGLGPALTRWLQDVAEDRSPNRVLLTKLAAAAGTRYLLSGRVIQFDTADEEGLPFEPPRGLENDVQPSLTRPKPFTVRKVVELEGQVWDAQIQRLVWRARGGVRVTEPQQAKDDHRMDDLSIRATKNLVAMLPDQRLEEARGTITQLEVSLKRATARVTELEDQIKAAGRREGEQVGRLRLLEAKLAEFLVMQAERETVSPALAAQGFQAAATALADRLRDEIAQGTAVVAFERGPRGGRVVLRIPSESLFALESSQSSSSGVSGLGAELTDHGRQILSRTAPPLTRLPGKARIVVEGHTDGADWERSVAWAMAVVRHLVSLGVDQTALLAAGRADRRPFGSNDSEEGRRRNRRIEIILLPEESPS